MKKLTLLLTIITITLLSVNIVKADELSNTDDIGWERDFNKYDEIFSNIEVQDTLIEIASYIDEYYDSIGQVKFDYLIYYHENKKEIRIYFAPDRSIPFVYSYGNNHNHIGYLNCDIEHIIYYIVYLDDLKGVKNIECVNAPSDYPYSTNETFTMITNYKTYDDVYIRYWSLVYNSVGVRVITGATDEYTYPFSDMWNNNPYNTPDIYHLGEYKYYYLGTHLLLIDRYSSGVDAGDFGEDIWDDVETDVTEDMSWDEKIFYYLKQFFVNMKNLPYLIGSEIKDIFIELFVPSSDVFDDLELLVRVRFQFIWDIKELFDKMNDSISTDDTPPTFNITLYGDTYSLIDFSIIEPYKDIIQSIITCICWYYFAKWVVNYAPKVIGGV